ncbi:hypothetical protein SteCoe_13504 [Stentor coeruleus]|uniref:Uncharacterized protein n=1 Tax=Stentor coeruleus TaxID=5963 RepID=A0A1R2C851_9CILI|nr:hypothetical protein SteCoe_13504 [Stentor coeruleus]
MNDSRSNNSEEDEPKAMMKNEISIQVDLRYLDLNENPPNYIEPTTFRARQQKRLVKNKCISLDSDSGLPRLNETKIANTNKSSRGRQNYFGIKRNHSRKTYSNLFVNNFNSHYKSKLIKLREKLNEVHIYKTPSHLIKGLHSEVEHPQKEYLSYNKLELLSKPHFKSPIITKKTCSYRKHSHSPRKPNNSKEFLIPKNNILDSLICTSKLFLPVKM